ncbi:MULTISPECIES: hypothetical protein [Actinomadura]|uniref:Uncharacterized protein n=1 Tax=Actinomadura yumaensis TaxID=111807 RepID=A0ABW2CHV0_9ACTN|nr:hypothetical protein [Actinomadura sp. J1-007]MWK32946.1 hypothetical protein [Actinomadura sp. J1-007]
MRGALGWWAERRSYPGWSIIRAEPRGRWWALRNPVVDERGQVVPYAVTALDRDTYGELAEALREQAGP